MKRFKFTIAVEVEECDECGRPLDENHPIRSVYCESCQCSLGYEVCAEDMMADFCVLCKEKEEDTR